MVSGPLSHKLDRVVVNVAGVVAGFVTEVISGVVNRIDQECNAREVLCGSDVGVAEQKRMPMCEPILR